MRDYADSTTEQRDSIANLLCDELEKGLSIRVACDKVGISDSAYRRWIKRAEQGDDEAIILVRRLKAARARGFEQFAGKIKLAADEDWRAAAWMIDKLYPNMRPEEIVLNLEQDEQLAEYANEGRVVQLCKWAVQAGLVTIEELTGIAPQPKPVAAIEAPPQPQQDRLMHVMQTVVVALSAGDREQRELRATVCKVLRCQPDQFDEACSRLAVEVVAQQGQKTLLRRPNQERTNQNVRVPEAGPVSEAEPPSPGGGDSYQLQPGDTRVPPDGSWPTPTGGNWFEGPGRSTGDVIRERRGE